MLWNQWHRRWLFSSPARPANRDTLRRPLRRSIRPTLETLESRLAPAMSNAGAGILSPPPSLFQASVSLFFDGGRLEANALGAQFGRSNFLNDPTPSNPGPNAAAENALNQLDAFLGIRTDSVIEADIASNLPYAGQFGLYFVVQGAMWANNIVSPQQ
jgi:hypothetical protein